MEESDQLLQVLQTIDEAEDFLRKRCAMGMAGQSLQLFENLDSLIELMREQFGKTEFLPQQTPYFSNHADALTAIVYLDQVQTWSKEIHTRIRRKRIRTGLARGTLFDVAEIDGKPFAKEAKTLVQKNALKSSGSPAIADEPRSILLPPETLANETADANSQVRNRSEEKRITPVRKSTRGIPEGEKLFEAMSRTSRGAPVKRMTSEKADEKPIEAPPLSLDTQPMETRENAITEKMPERYAWSGARPIGAPEEKTLERPARSGARPMGVSEEKTAEQPVRSGARPMRAPEEKAAERPVRSGAHPMDTPEEKAKQSPAQAAHRTSSTRHDQRNAVDRAFFDLMDKVDDLSEKEMLHQMTAGFPMLENRYRMVMADLARRYPYGGVLHPDSRNYELFQNRTSELKAHFNDFLWLYGRLEDYRSRKTLYAILSNWLEFNFKELSNVKEKMFPNYFDYDLLRCNPRGVFVDGGAGAGTASEEFLNSFGVCRKILCYEISDANFALLRENAAKIPNVELRQKGLSDEIGHSPVDTWGGDASTAHLSAEGVGQIETVTLDEDYPAPVATIKLSLAGGEERALVGCKKHIVRDHPCMIVRLDHKNEDLWKLPRFIDEYDQQYRLYLRHYGGNIMPAEYVVIAT